MSPALVAAVHLAGQALMVGAPLPKTVGAKLDCPPPAVQHTILRCTVKDPLAAGATSLGRTVGGVSLNLHYQGQVLNMSVELGAGSAADDVIAQLRSALGEPKLQYWADDAHLYASFIWVDGKSELEVTKTVKGDSNDGKTRFYVSSLLRSPGLNPEDAPKTP